MKQLGNMILFGFVLLILLGVGSCFVSLSEGQRNERADRFMARLETLVLFGGILVLTILAGVAGVVIAHAVNMLSRAARLPGQQLPGALGGLERQLEEWAGTEETYDQ